MKEMIYYITILDWIFRDSDSWCIITFIQFIKIQFIYFFFNFLNFRYPEAPKTQLKPDREKYH